MRGQVIQNEISSRACKLLGKYIFKKVAWKTCKSKCKTIERWTDQKLHKVWRWPEWIVAPRVLHPINTKITETPVDLLHVDLCEIKIYSLGGAKYFLLLKDDYTQIRTVSVLENTNEVPEILKICLELVEDQFDRKVKVLRSGNGTEIKYLEIQQTWENLDMLHCQSSAYTP